ncbi:MAG: bacillithiol system redox-active protein YtxJ [Cyclobacteriaceae bacterium]
MNWNKLTQIETLEEIKSKSQTQPVLIYKHSTRCNISSMVLHKLERQWKPEEMRNVEIYFLDLIAHRDVSNAIESDFSVRHESPQVLVITDGVCSYHDSHMGITYQALRRNLGSIEAVI